MKYVDEFRDGELARKLVTEIRQRCRRTWTLMEVCGGQTHGLLRYGIEQELRGVVELIHGPGCPVCVTPAEDIDLAIEWAGRPDVMLTSFGDMLRVPASQGSLMSARARGADVKIVYSPLDAVAIARANPDRMIIFFAVGFETTAPATALALLQAADDQLDNFCLLVSHVRVQPAMEQIAQDPGNRVQAFLAAGHVCTVMGYNSYHSFAQRHQLPVVVTGFEPLDLLTGILQAVKQLEEGRPEVENQYPRGVTAEGNIRAQAVINSVYEICDQPWRGLGVIPAGGLRIREAYHHYDARARLPCPEGAAGDGGRRCEVLPCHDARCRSAEVLAGRLKPTECEEFAAACTPDNPLGAPMVSSEGACAAYFRYRGGSDE